MSFIPQWHKTSQALYKVRPCYIICLHNLIVLSNTMHKWITNASNAFECLFRPTYYSFLHSYSLETKKSTPFNKHDSTTYSLPILMGIPAFTVQTQHTDYTVWLLVLFPLLLHNLCKLTGSLPVCLLLEFCLERRRWVNTSKKTTKRNFIGLKNKAQGSN